jgi:hypothetical protein
MDSESAKKRSEEMNEGAVILCFIIVSFLLGSLFGGTITSNSWETYCQKAGLRVAGDKVYECKEKK